MRTTDNLKQKHITIDFVRECKGRVLVTLNYKDDECHVDFIEVDLSIRAIMIAGWLKDNFKTLLEEFEAEDKALLKHRLDYIFCNIREENNNEYDVKFLIETVENFLDEIIAELCTIVDLIADCFEDITVKSYALKSA